MKMIDADKWLSELVSKLREAFGERLLFVGLQGSYGRGEATENSDLDAVVILETLGINELETYRDVVSSMPDADKACGFVSGRAELAAWPKHEIFQISRETVPLFGNFDELLPSVERGDIAESARIGASAMYHALCHTYIHGDSDARIAAICGAYKGSFFILQLLHYLRTGYYPLSKKELLPLLDGDERKILETCIALKDGSPLSEASEKGHFDLLIRWCARVLKNELNQ